MGNQIVKEARARCEQRLALGMGEDDDGFVGNGERDESGGEKVFGLAAVVGLAAG